MAKRAADDEQTSPGALKSGDRPVVDEAAEGEQFEDEFEDEFESEDEILEAGVDGRPDEEREAEERASGAMEVDQQTFIPGRHKLEAGQTLAPDLSTYEMLHTLEATWPCLSFDIVKDSLGDNRKSYPATVYSVAGTQAAQGRERENQIMVMKLSGLSRNDKAGNFDSDSDSDDDEENTDPILETKSIPLTSTTNRIRAHQSPQASSSSPPTTITAAMQESGDVLIHDVTPHLQAFDLPGFQIPANASKPLCTIRAHKKSEGYALDWSPMVPAGKLLTGDSAGSIFATTRTEGGGFVTDTSAYTGHTGSVEELQWSPNERNVFASASSDGTVRIWDARSKSRKHAVSVKASTSDVNVLSWSHQTPHLLASGHDDGTWSVWDLRQWKTPDTAAKSTPVAHFNFHKEQITSLEWHPTDDSIVSVCCGDNTLTLWDLAVELDDEESRYTADVKDVPPQLLFVHYMEQVKEAHWHPQIPGAVMATGGAFHKPSPASSNAQAVAKLASSNLTFEVAYGQQPQQAPTTSRGSWLARVSHRASHIPNRPLTSSSRDNLPLRTKNDSANAGYRSHEQLPGVIKTISHPGSPNRLVSPTETEFMGHTPIDASFGDRIDPPPDRPLPDRPQLNSRAGQPNQRSRSGTATQADSAPRLPELENMDKYAIRMGDRSYDSDGEADDEYDRSDLGILSPSEAAHYDDGESDHPSESEEEHASLDGEDTPTTQGWGDRDGRSPMGKITQWNEDQVADFISSLGSQLKQYSQTFAEEAVDGDALIALHHDELRELGVNSIGHRLTILKAVYEQKIRAGVKIEEDEYIPLSADGDTGDLNATQDDITRVIESIKLRDQRIIATEAELRQLKNDLDRVSEENRKLREETLPIMRLVKDQRTPLPDPAGGTIPSPREPPKEESKGSSLSRKFSKKLLLGGVTKQPSPTHPPITSQPREVKEDAGTHLEASAAAMAASSHLTASMTSQTSPISVHNQQLSPTSPYTTQATQRSFPREATSTPRYDPRVHPPSTEDTGTGFSVSSQWSQASTAVADSTSSARGGQDRRRGQPSPRAVDDGSSTRERARGEVDDPQVEIFKSFRVSIEDPCRVVLPVALKRYNIQDDWRQYALYIVHGDQERCLGLEEKPLLLFKQLDKEGRKPMFMLRRHAAPAEGWSNYSTAASQNQESGGKQVPGGVL